MAGRQDGMTSAKDRVLIFDTTLRDGEQSPGASMNLDEKLRGIRTMLPTLEAHKAAVLAGLAVTDELFRARRSDGELAARITTITDDLTRLLPPGKRGLRGGMAE